jgi:hypothetical protein
MREGLPAFSDANHSLITRSVTEAAKPRSLRSLTSSFSPDIPTGGLLVFCQCDECGWLGNLPQAGAADIRMPGFVYARTERPGACHQPVHVQPRPGSADAHAGRTDGDGA